MIRTALPSSEIRLALMRRARRHAEMAGTSLSAIGVSAVGDSKFLHRVENGSNFSIRTYQRVLDWLDAEEAKLPERAA